MQDFCAVVDYFQYHAMNRVHIDPDHYFGYALVGVKAMAEPHTGDPADDFEGKNEVVQETCSAQVPRQLPSGLLSL